MTPQNPRVTPSPPLLEAITGQLFPGFRLPWQELGDSVTFTDSRRRGRLIVWSLRTLLASLAAASAILMVALLATLPRGTRTDSSLYVALSISLIVFAGGAIATRGPAERRHIRIFKDGTALTQITRGRESREEISRRRIDSVALRAALWDEWGRNGPIRCWILEITLGARLHVVAAYFTRVRCERALARLPEWLRTKGTYQASPVALAPIWELADLSRQCRSCGYDRRGLSAWNVCPECGQTPRDPR